MFQNHPIFNAFFIKTFVTFKSKYFNIFNLILFKNNNIIEK